jgi:transposase
MDCPVRTFVEQVEGLSTRYARRTVGLRRSLEQIALALAGRAGARLAERLGLPVGRNSMLRLIRALPDPAPGQVTAVGIDDFAVRRGHRYGTVLVDMDTHRPIDLLPDRESATVAVWLGRHPEVDVVCRDRAGAYADAARTAAPQAIQVADRWHIWHNLAQHAEKTAARHASCVAAAAAPTARQRDEPIAVAVDSAPAPTGSSAGKLPARIRRHYKQIRALTGEGKGIKVIARELGLSRGTVRRFTRATSVEELLPAAPRPGRVSILAPFAEHLWQRWNDGTTNATTLFKELQALGYRGGYSALRDHVRAFRSGQPPATASPPPPKGREITNLLMRHPDTLDDNETTTLQQIRSACPHLDRLAHHIAQFAKMLTGLHGQDLDAWITAVKGDDQPDLHSFARGIEADYDAVRNGLTLAHNSGTVEGHVNRIKTLKRQMYGRANFDLLPVD